MCLIIFKVLMTYLIWCEEQKIWKFWQGKYQNSLSHIRISFQQKNIKLLLLNSFKLWLCCSVSRLCPTLCNPMNCNMPGFPVPSPSPRDCSNSCPLSQWCHATISSSVISLSCLQSFPESGSFPMSRLFTSDGPKYWSFSFSIIPSSEKSGLISFRID